MKFSSFIALLFFLAAASCSSVQPTAVSRLTPFYTPIVVQPTPIQPPTQSQLQLPTPTPVIHVVAAGETISSIAPRYGVEPSAIIAANPNVDPNAMGIGTKLLIPAQSSSGFFLTEESPLKLDSGPLTCTRFRGDGIQCFLLIRNSQNLPVENLQARIILGNEQTGEVKEQLTTAPLNILYPGQAMAISAFFSSPVSAPFQSRFEMVRAQAVQDGNNRYLETKLENQQVTISSNALSAKVYGEISLAASTGTASAVWVAGIAYDNEGNVVGVRRWESNSPLSAGQKIPLAFTVYSSGAAIERVDVLLEARK